MLFQVKLPDELVGMLNDFFKGDPRMEIKLEIKFVPGQPVEVTGPIEDKLLCYGLLVEAHDAVQAYHAKKGEGKIQVARIIP